MQMHDGNNKNTIRRNLINYTLRKPIDPASAGIG